jgi:hypothetical protein
MKKVIMNSQNLANGAAMSATQFPSNNFALTAKQLMTVKGGKSKAIGEEDLIGV